MNFSTIPFLHQLYKFKWIPGSKSYKIMIWSTDNPPVEMIRHIINVNKNRIHPNVLQSYMILNSKKTSHEGEIFEVFGSTDISIFFWSGSTLSRVERFFMFLCWVFLYVFVGKIWIITPPKILTVGPLKIRQGPKRKGNHHCFRGELLNFGGVSSPWLHHGWWCQAPSAGMRQVIS